MTSYSWAGVTGDWNSTNWSPSGTPTANDSATISAAGTYTVTVDSSDVASSVTLSGAGATLSIGASGTLSLSGRLTVSAGAFTLATGGMLSGGAFYATGGAISWTGGTLSGVTVWGPLNLTDISASVHLAKGATVVGASGSGAGVINATGSGASLYLDDAQMLANQTINLGYSANGLNYLQLATGGATYGLAATSTLNIVGRSEINDKAASTTFLNSGAINVSGGVLQITGFGLWNYDDYFTNAGSLTINSGGNLLTEISNFTNSGTITVNTGAAATIDPTTFTTTSTSKLVVGASATLTINAHNNWNNLGSISIASGATLLLEDDTITSASLGALTNSGGTLAIGAGAVYSNTGATLTGTSGLGVLTLQGGTISGGTVAAGALAFSAKGGTLSGVTVDGPITLGAGQALSLAAGDQLYSASGTGAGVVNVSGAGAILNLGSDVALAGETINLGNSANSVAYVELNVAGSAYALGATATLNVLGSANLDYDRFASSFTNNGQIAVSSGGFDIIGYANVNDVFVNAGAFTLADATSLYSLNLASFTNSGSIVAGADDSLTLAAKTFIDNGSISIGANSSLVLDPTNLTVGSSGSISVGANGYAYIEPFGSWTNLSSNTLTGGSYAVGNNALFDVYSSQTLTTLAANLSLTGAGSSFQLSDPTTGVGVDLEQSLTTIASTGALSLLGGRGWTTAGAAISNSGVLTLAGGTIAATASGASLGQSANGKLVGYGTVTATTFANAGTIEASGGTLTLTNAVTGAGALVVDAGANLVVGGSIASGASASFGGANATLTLKAPASFGATIGALGTGDAIDLVGVVANGVKVSGSQLIVTENGTTVATLNLSSAAAAESFAVSAISGGSAIGLAPPGVTVAQYLAAVSTYDQAANGVAIWDTAANIVANIASLNDTHIVSIGASSGTPTVSVSAALTYKATLDKITAGYAVSDTAANILASLGSLTDAKISSIIVANNGAINATVSQLTSSATQIAKLATSSGASYQVGVSDTAANIVSGAATLQSNVSHLATIAPTSGTVTVTAATAKADLAALNKVVGGFAVADTAGNIAANIATLGPDAAITTLSATSGTGALSGVSTIAAKTFSVSGSGTAVTIGANISDAGAFSLGSGATLSIASGDTFTVLGTATLAGTVSGAGQLTTKGGSTTTGATLTVSKWASSGESITVGSALTYAGAMSAWGGDVLNLTGGALTLSGVTMMTGGVTTKGTKALVLKGATTISGAWAIGGTGGVSLSAALKASGGNVTLGDSAGNADTLTIASTATFNFADDHSLLRGSSSASSIANAGLLEKTGGTALTNIAPTIANTGTIKVTAGTLELSGAVTGTGSETISGASILEFAGSAGAGQTVSFSGAGGALELLSPSSFSAKISGFDTGGATGDSLILAAPWAFSGFSENAAGTLGTLTVVNGSTTATLSLTGNYTASHFAHATNASGQMVVTYA